MARSSPSSRTVSRMKSSSSATTSSRVGSRVARRRSRAAPTGCPARARPTITAEAPVVASTACARACEVTSPEAITGTSTSDTSSAVSEWSAVPVYICLRRARVQRQRRRARLDEPRPDRRGTRASRSRVPRRIFTDTGSGVARRDRLDDPRGVVGVVEQRRAGAGLRHLPDRAAEVDVDDVGAGGLDHPRRLGHRAGLGAEDLDRERMLVRRRRAGSRASARCRCWIPAH